MPFTNPDAVPGPDEKVIVGPFEAIVVDRYNFPGSVELKVDGKSITIPLEYLSKPIPYTDQTVYMDASGQYLIYVSSSPLIPGVFYDYDIDDEAYDPSDGPGNSYNYPSRPLRAVTFGPALND